MRHVVQQSLDDVVKLGARIEDRSSRNYYFWIVMTVRVGECFSIYHR